jgi:glycosyltransferase involved in cell wall biosynthesis
VNNSAVHTPTTRPHLAVFFTRGMSLEGWHRAGILQRELALYRRLNDDLGALTFVTYGNDNDERWAETMPGLSVLPNRWRLPSNLYSVLAPLLHWRHLRHVTIFKTNQLNGAWTGAIAKLLFRKPLIVRCGFLWANFMARLTEARWRRKLARTIERVVLRSADRIIVAGEADAETVAADYAIPSGRIAVVPNFVDTSQFCPASERAVRSGRLVFVGRLEAQKNVAALIEAVAALPEVTLVIAGDGALRGELEALARKSGARVEFVGRVPHETLPSLLKGAELFVLPSHFEGNPKSLIEAMASGVPVVGARSPGIERILLDGETGVVCGTSATQIRDAIERVRRDQALRERITQNALAWVRTYCSLDTAVARERVVIASVNGAPTLRGVHAG